MKVDSSGGAIISTKPGSAGAKSNANNDRDSDPPKQRRSIRPKDLAPALSPMTTTTRATKKVSVPGVKDRSQPAAMSIAPAKDPEPPGKKSADLVPDASSLTRTASTPQPPVTPRMTSAADPLGQSGVSRLLSFVALAAAADGRQPATSDSPLFAAFFAAGRQVFASIDRRRVRRRARLGSTETSLMAATTNSPAVFQVNATRGLFTRDTTKPTVSLAAPAGGAPVSGTVTLNATASDNVGVTQVQVLY